MQWPQGASGFGSVGEDPGSDFEPGIYICIAAGGHSLNVIRGERFGASVFFQNIDGFVVGDRSFFGGGISANQNFAANMNAGSENRLPVFCCTQNPVIDIQDLQIFPPEIRVSGA